mgnify:CR=1 FL=1
MAYIDTSLLVAYYCPEFLSDAAARVIGGGDFPCINPLVEVEFCSALGIKIRTGELTVPPAERILSRFRLHLEEGRYCVVPLKPGEYALAAEWIARFSTPLRTADALHLASAFTNELRLLTADRRLARSAEHFGVDCELIE